MARLKIDYGIDLGTTNSAIFRMDKGESRAIKIEVTDEIMPSCVYFNRKKSIVVGSAAYRAMKSDKKSATKKWISGISNTYVEFKRDMGSDKKVMSSNMGKEYTPEQLSAEVLKTLKSFVTDEAVKSAVITVPAKFTINQKDATMRAAKLAGIEHCELLQEPIAASMAYGLNSDIKHGIWLVFDFGGGTFDAALVKVEDGIMQVFDTEGDNYLGGKNLDYAIVDNIIIPYLQENFVLDEILNNELKKNLLRDAMKTYAEDAKNQLSFKEKEDIISNVDELGKDDNGSDLELDMTITQVQLKEVLSPIFQKAVSICNVLLERNNLSGNQLSSLILVGGPTFSPILRQMLIDQITTKVDTSIDPMTAVACGAALYASTIENKIKEKLSSGTVALDITYESTTVETMEFVTIRLLPKDSVGSVPTKLYAEITRGDKSWASGKIEINEIGDVVECQLLEGKANTFIIQLFDDNGTTIPCSPNEINIIQGSKVGSAVLPYSIGIELWDSINEKAVFSSIKGLERNKMLPSTGVKNSLKTTCNLRPGIESDFIKIPIYQGDEGADGLKALYFELVYTAIITGENVPALLPSGSDVDITIKVDRSEGMFMEVFFPSLNHTEEIKFDKDTVQTDVSSDYLQNEIDMANSYLQKLKDNGIETENLELELSSVQKELDNGDQKKQVLQHLKESLRKIDKIDSEGEWDRTEKELRNAFNMLEVDNGKYGNSSTTKSVEELRSQVNTVILNKDLSNAKDLTETIGALNYQIAKIEYYIAWIIGWNNRFNTINWKDKPHARVLINQAIEIINNIPTTGNLVPIINEIIQLLPTTEIPKGATGLLQGE